ncbi:FAD-dependent oxidoreductase [Micromonospora sp. M12]
MSEPAGQRGFPEPESISTRWRFCAEPGRRSARSWQAGLVAARQRRTPAWPGDREERPVTDRPEEYDLLVVGGGKAGKTLSMDVARSGQRVAMVERGMIGGSCINVACIPTKALVTSARAARQLRDASALGLVVQGGGSTWTCCARTSRTWSRDGGRQPAAVPRLRPAPGDRPGPVRRPEDRTGGARRRR